MIFNRMNWMNLMNGLILTSYFVSVCCRLFFCLYIATETMPGIFLDNTYFYK